MYVRCPVSCVARNTSNQQLGDILRNAIIVCAYAITDLETDILAGMCANEVTLWDLNFGNAMSIRYLNISHKWIV